MTQAVATADLRGAGRRLGKYTLLRRIGRGGMADVWLARSHGIERIDKLVAVKLVSPHLADDPAFVAMLRQEARTATNLDHPNIAAVIDFAVSEGESFLVTEYVHGYSLYDVLRAAAGRGSVVPMGIAIGIARAVAEALHYAHEACNVDGRPLGIVHRDVSPSNVLLRYDGVVKVVDFGIAKATGVQGPTESGVLKGKCSYMSPEQCNALVVDRRTDVFALGIVLFELTTGRRLFGGRNDFEVMNRITRGEVVPPSRVQPGYPPALEQVVLRALALRPGDRHPDAAAVQSELEVFAREERLDTSPLRLRELLDELIGPRPHPALEIEATGSGIIEPTQGSAARSTAERARRRRLRLVLAGGVVATAALTVVVAQALASAPTRGDEASRELELERAPAASEREHANKRDDVRTADGSRDDASQADAELEAASDRARSEAPTEAPAADPNDRRPARDSRRARVRPPERSNTPKPDTPRRPSGSLFPDGG